MATIHADRIAKGLVYMGAYIPGDLAARAERVILPNRRSEFLRRAIEHEVDRIERQYPNDPELHPELQADGTD